MTQEQKDIILRGARYEMMNACIYYDTGIVDKEKMAEAMQNYADMYHQNELSKLRQHNVSGELAVDECKCIRFTGGDKWYPNGCKVHPNG